MHKKNPTVFILSAGFLLAEGIALRERLKPDEWVYVFCARVLTEYNFDPAKHRVFTCDTFRPGIACLADYQNIVAELNRRGYTCAQ